MEVTPFPVSAVMGARGNPILLASVLISESRKGHVPRCGIPVAVRKLKARFDPYSPASVRRRWGRFAFEAETLFHLSRRQCSADDAVQAILNRKPDLRGKPHLFEEGVGTLLLQRAAVEVFCDSLVRKSSKPGFNSISEMTHDIADVVRRAYMAADQGFQVSPGRGGIPNVGPRALLGAVPFFDALRGVGGTLSRVIRKLPSGDFMADPSWLEIVKTMQFHDDLA